MKFVLIDDNDTVYGYASGDRTAAGGAERYVWLLTRALAAHGWAVKVGVREALPQGTRITYDGVEFIGVGSGQILKAFYRLVRSERPDWCHWAGASHILGPAVAIAKATGTRTIYSVQFDLDVKPREALHRRSGLWPLFALGLWGSDRIFLQHQQQLANLPAGLRKKASIIPGVVELAAATKSHHERRPYVAWVGVLRQPKRPDLLIEIARRVPSIEFVVCGGASDHRSPPGYSEAILRELKAIPNITYVGHVAPARAIEIIAGAHVLLSTSEAEGFPSVFLEAWANGTPVVSLTIDPDHLIEQRGLGRKSETVERAAADILELVNVPDGREAIATACRQYVTQCHSGAAAVAAVERALRVGADGVLRSVESAQS